MSIDEQKFSSITRIKDLESKTKRAICKTCLNIFVPNYCFTVTDCLAQSGRLDKHLFFISSLVQKAAVWMSLVITSFYHLLTSFRSMTYKVGAPIPITGIQFGMRVEFGYDCLIPADFNNDVSI